MGMGMETRACFEPRAAPNQARGVCSKGEEREEGADLLHLGLQCTPTSHTLHTGDATLREEGMVDVGGDMAGNSQQQSASSDCWQEIGRQPHQGLEMQRGMAVCESAIAVVNKSLLLDGTRATIVHDAAAASAAAAAAGASL